MSKMFFKRFPAPGPRIPDPVFAVILVGGRGKRLRPLSTDSRPKAFLSVTKDNETLFRNTVDRIKKLIPLENIIVVANRRHGRLVKADLGGIEKHNLLLEPMSRNTAPAIALAAKTLQQKYDDAIMVVLPADHYIVDEAKYLSSLKRAIDFVKHRKDAIVTIGIDPDFPSTHFGYIKIRGPGSGDRGPGDKIRGVYKVERFVEKPHLEKAKRFVKSKNYLWNSGIFIFRAGYILKTIEEHMPDLARRIKNMRKMDKAYRALPDISIDYAVMENTPDIYCVKGSHGWHDIGNFENLKKILNIESKGYIEKEGKVLKIL